MDANNPIHLNNLAINLLQQENYAKAGQILQKAIQCICDPSLPLSRRKMRTTANNDHVCSYTSSNGNKRRKCFRQSTVENHIKSEVRERERKRGICCIPLHVKEESEDAPTSIRERKRKLNLTIHDTEQQGCFKVFDRALTIEDDDDDALLEGQEKGDSMFVSGSELQNFKAILLYNLALTHHMDALRTGKSKKLAVALQFYQLTFDFLERLKDLFPMEEMILQLLALFTNMTSIHTSHFNIEMVSYCMGWMESAILSAEVQSLEYDDFEYFYYNIVVFSARNQVRLAPAA